MIFNRNTAPILPVLVAIILLFISGCSNKKEVPEITAPPSLPAGNHLVSICENVFTAYRSGEVSGSDLKYVDTKANIALRETDIITNRDLESSFWIMISLKDLIPAQNYNLRYELFTGNDELFRSESFIFTPGKPEHKVRLKEELNPQNRKNLSAGEWLVKVYLNDTLFGSRQFSILSEIPGQDVVIKKYEWKDFQFQYPGYCSIEEDRDIVNEEGIHFRLVKLTISEKNRIGLFIHFTDEWTPPVDVNFQQSPAMANMMLCLPIALKHAEPVGAEAIALSVGSIELADGFNLATRFNITKPDSELFSTMECFHRDLSDKMFFGILFTQGFKGRGSDTPEYFRLIQDTYSIIRSISTSSELMSDANKPKK